MDTTHLVVIRPLTGNATRKVRVYAAEATVPAIVEANWGACEIIAVVPVAELATV